MPLGPKIGPPQGSHVLHWFILGKNEKIFLFDINFMLSLIESAVRFIIKAVLWAAWCLSLTLDHLMNRYFQVSDPGPLDPLILIVCLFYLKQDLLVCIRTDEMRTWTAYFSYAWFCIYGFSNLETRVCLKLNMLQIKVKKSFCLPILCLQKPCIYIKGCFW